MLEVIRLLKDHGAFAVVTRGWAADVLPSKRVLPHSGTVDVDLVLVNREVPGHNETTIMEALSSNGYRQDNERFQYHRTVITDIGSEGPEETKFLRRDSYELVNFLLKALGIRGISS